MSREVKLTQSPTVSMLQVQHVVFGTLSMLCFIVGTTANCLSLFYFIRTQGCNVQTLTPILFMSLNVVDIIQCVLMLPVGISNLLSGKPGLLAYEALCHVWSILFNVSVRYSIFIIGVMSVTRCIALLTPLYRIKRRVVVVVVVTYLLLLLIQEGVPLVYSLDAIYDNDIMMSCSYNLTALFPPESKAMKAYYFVSTVVEGLLPMIPILTSCALSVYELNKPHQRDLGCGKVERKNEATVTIVTLTIVYLAFNIPFVLMGIESSLFLFSNQSVDVFGALGASIRTIDIINCVVLLYAMALNAACNPIVYFTRIRRFRLFVMGLVQRERAIPKLDRRVQSIMLADVKRTRRNNAVRAPRPSHNEHVEQLG